MRDEKSGQQWGEAMDSQSHMRAYEGFLRLVKWSTGVVALILILMALFLT
ncbi:MAG: aa3-type cytochrome c oxidase subunit IV [Parvularculales bacterium]